jgi:YgiT-type zinc finger domain-containing protein
MKCIICNSEDITKKPVDEEIRSGDDIFLFPMEVLVCNSCGERYYDRATMGKLEDARKNILEKKVKYYKVGEIYKT